MSSRGPGTTVYLFETTTFVLWAEEVARELDMPTEVIPAPPPRGDLCGTALRVLASDAVALESAMEGAGISFHRFADPSESNG